MSLKGYHVRHERKEGKYGANMVRTKGVNQKYGKPIKNAYQAEFGDKKRDTIIFTYMAASARKYIGEWVECVDETEKGSHDYFKLRCLVDKNTVNLFLTWKKGPIPEGGVLVDSPDLVDCIKQGMSMDGEFSSLDIKDDCRFAAYPNGSLSYVLIDEEAFHPVDETSAVPYDEMFRTWLHQGAFNLHCRNLSIPTKFFNETFCEPGESLGQSWRDAIQRYRGDRPNKGVNIMSNQAKLYGWIRDGVVPFPSANVPEEDKWIFNLTIDDMEEMMQQFTQNMKEDRKRKRVSA